MQDLKKIKDNTPSLYEFAKKASVSLEDTKLVNKSAKVALCIDISETMMPYLLSGKAQVFAEKILALGMILDSNSAIDVFLLANKAAYNIGSMTPDNFGDFINDALKKYESNHTSDYIHLIHELEQFYFPNDVNSGTKVVTSDEPVYAMVLTNGHTTDETATIQEMIKVSYKPIFWQFMAVGVGKEDLGSGIWAWLMKPFAEDYSFLKTLDDMPNRFLDNADFFNVTDPSEIKSEDLYRALLTEYPDWLQRAENKKMFV